MPRPTHPKLTKLDLLSYALEGALVNRGLNTGNPHWHESDFVELDKHIAEIERRIKLCHLATARKESQP